MKVTKKEVELLLKEAKRLSTSEVSSEVDVGKALMNVLAEHAMLRLLYEKDYPR